MWPLILFAPLLLAIGQDPAPSATSGQTIVFFPRAEGRVPDETLLLDAVAIYTRDLGVTVVRVDNPHPSSSMAVALDDAVVSLRARSARLGFWYQLAADNRSLELVTVDARRRVTRQSFINDAPSVDLYRAMALKIRVLLVSAEPPSRPPPAPPSPPLAASPSPRAAASPPPSSAGSPSPRVAASPPPPPPPPAAPAAPPLAASPSPATPIPAAVASEGSVNPEADRATPPLPTVVDAAATEPAPWSPSSSRRLMVGVGYALSLPSGSASWRHAAAVHATASLRRPVEAELGLELAPSDSQTAPTGNLSVMDVPVRVGVRLVRRGPSAVLGLGVIAGAHLLFVHALAPAPDTATDRTWAVTGAGGVEFVARPGNARGLVPELRLWVEAKAPRTRFLVRGADPRFEAGAFGAGISLGLTLVRQ